MSNLGKFTDSTIIKRTNPNSILTSKDSLSPKIISPKQSKGNFSITTRINNFQKCENETMSSKNNIIYTAEQSISPTKNQERKYSEQLPNNTQALNKKKTSPLFNSFTSIKYQFYQPLIKIKSDYTFNKINEERNLSFSPPFRKNLMASPLSSNKTTRKGKKLIKEKNTNYLYIVLPGNNSELIKKCMGHRINWTETTNMQNYNFKWQHISAGLDFDNLSKHPSNKNTVNHLEFHQALSNKMNLFINLMKFCEKKNIEMFRFTPFTLTMQFDSKSFIQQFENFTDIFNNIKNYIAYDADPSIENSVKYGSLFKVGYEGDKLGLKTSILMNPSYYIGKNMWLVKAVDLNRGRCIKIGNDVDEVKTIIKNFYEGIYKSFKKEKEEEKKKDKKVKNIEQTEKEYKSQKDEKQSKKKKKKKCQDYRKYRTSRVLLQKYLECPLLYWGRKFDVRVWVLYTHKECVYAFKQGHLKTSSLTYDINESNCFVHLTNYSVQKYNHEFSKHECGNEVSFGDFQNSLNFQFGEGKVDVEKDIMTKIHKLIKLTFFSVREKINMNNRKFCFELFGFDFIIDKNLEVYLLEVNTNPGLEESSPWISILLPRMIDDALRLTIDDIYETKYANVKEGGEYESPYYVEGYDSNENLWKLVTDFSDFSDINSI